MARAAANISADGGPLEYLVRRRGAAIVGGIFDNGDNTNNVFENEGSGGPAVRINGPTHSLRHSAAALMVAGCADIAVCPSSSGTHQFRSRLTSMDISLAPSVSRP